MTAAYAGDANTTASTSAAMTVTVLNASDVVFRNGLEMDVASCPVE